MKLFKKIGAYIQAKIDKYVVKRFAMLLPKDLITSLYKQIAERDLVITTKEVQVKKGNRKYTLLVAKDKNLATVFNLGRHEENEKDFPSIAKMQGERMGELLLGEINIPVVSEYSFPNIPDDGER
jgi:hypothetical protein